MEIKINDYEEFAKEFISRYSIKGFGSMNKNDFEVMIFDLFRRYGELQGKSNYEISLKLQIPESKVKRLSYEADLKYQRDNIINYVKENFFKAIEKAKFKSDNQRIQFVLEDKYIRGAIDNELKKSGFFSDSSFNSEIVSVHIDAFIYLLEKYYSEDVTKRIVKECKSVIKEETKVLDFKSLMKQFLNGVANKAGEVSASVAFAAISHGATSVVGVVNAIKEALTK